MRTKRPKIGRQHLTRDQRTQRRYAGKTMSNADDHIRTCQNLSLFQIIRTKNLKKPELIPGKIELRADRAEYREIIEPQKRSRQFETI